MGLNARSIKLTRTSKVLFSSFKSWIHWMTMRKLLNTSFLDVQVNKTIGNICSESLGPWTVMMGRQQIYYRYFCCVGTVVFLKQNKLHHLVFLSFFPNNGWTKCTQLVLLNYQVQVQQINSCRGSIATITMLETNKTFANQIFKYPADQLWSQFF